MIGVTQLRDILYGVPEATDIQEMVELLADVFSRFEPPAVAIGLSFDDLRELVRPYGQRAPSDGLTIIARVQTTGRLIGAMLTDDFASPPPVSTGKPSENFEPIAALLEGLDEQYREIQPVVPGEILHLFMLGVAPDFGGKGIASTLVRLTLEHGAHRGYITAVTEATGNVSQHIFRNLGFVERFRLAYREFIYRDRRPFQTIAGHETIILMERSLEA